MKEKKFSKIAAWWLGRWLPHIQEKGKEDKALSISSFLVLPKLQKPNLTKGKARVPSNAEVKPWLLKIRQNNKLNKTSFPCPTNPASLWFQLHCSWTRNMLDEFHYYCHENIEVQIHFWTDAKSSCGTVQFCTEWEYSDSYPFDVSLKTGLFVAGFMSYFFFQEFSPS